MATVWLCHNFPPTQTRRHQPQENQQSKMVAKNWESFALPTGLFISAPVFPGSDCRRSRRPAGSGNAYLRVEMDLGGVSAAPLCHPKEDKGNNSGWFVRRGGATTEKALLVFWHTTERWLLSVGPFSDSRHPFHSPPIAPMSLFQVLINTKDPLSITD